MYGRWNQKTKPKIWKLYQGSHILDDIIKNTEDIRKLKNTIAFWRLENTLSESIVIVLFHAKPFIEHPSQDRHLPNDRDMSGSREDMIPPHLGNILLNESM